MLRGSPHAWWVGTARSSLRPCTILPSQYTRGGWGRRSRASSQKRQGTPTSAVWQRQVFWMRWRPAFSKDIHSMRSSVRSAALVRRSSSSARTVIAARSASRSVPWPHICCTRQPAPFSSHDRRTIAKPGRRRSSSGSTARGAPRLPSGRQRGSRRASVRRCARSSRRRSRSSSSRLRARWHPGSRRSTRPRCMHCTCFRKRPTSSSSAAEGCAGSVRSGVSVSGSRTRRAARSWSSESL